MNKGKYVDGFVFPVAKNKVAAYIKMAEWGAKTWMKYGALAYYECMGDDLAVKADHGTKPRSFKDMANAKGTDTVWFSFIVYKNKAHRNAVNKKVMAYFSKKYVGSTDQSMPFDPARMAYGGFSVVVG